MTIRATDGRSVTNTVYAPKGAALLGIDWADIEAKYLILMPSSGLAPDRIEASLALIRNLPEAAGVSPLIEMVRPG